MTFLYFRSNKHLLRAKTFALSSIYVSLNRAACLCLKPPFWLCFSSTLKTKLGPVLSLVLFKKTKQKKMARKGKKKIKGMSRGHFELCLIVFVPYVAPLLSNIYRRRLKTGRVQTMVLSVSKGNDGWWWHLYLPHALLWQHNGRGCSMRRLPAE